MRARRCQVHELHACTDAECLRRVRELLIRMWETSPDVAEPDRTMFETAVLKIAAGIARHGAEGDRPCNLVLEVYPHRLDARFLGARFRDDNYWALDRTRRAA